MKCQLCDGTGRLLKPWYDTTGMMAHITGDLCFMCDGTGEITEETAKKTTNFDRITESPEKLAEWLNEHSDYCREIQNWQCDKCPYGDKDCPIENTWLDWLNEENKE